MQPEATRMDQGAKERQREITGAVQMKEVLTHQSNRSYTGQRPGLQPLNWHLCLYCEQEYRNRLIDLAL